MRSRRSAPEATSSGSGSVDTAVRHYDRSRPRFAVHHADGRVVEDGYFAMCFNTTPYTYLSPTTKANSG